MSLPAFVAHYPSDLSPATDVYKKRRILARSTTAASSTPFRDVRILPSSKVAHLLNPRLAAVSVNWPSAFEDGGQ